MEVLQTGADGRYTRAELLPMLQRASAETGLPVALLDAVIFTESRYHPQARSPVGARGLMQLMPGTATAMGVEKVWDPEENVRGGARYLKWLVTRFGSLRVALAAYNGGPMRVRKNGVSAPLAHYAQVVLQRAERSPFAELR